MYHQVTPHPPAAFRKYAVTPKMFAAQMRYLAISGHRPISLDSLIAYRAGRLRLPAHPAIITFDDGFRDCVDYAVPILRRYGFTAVFYLVAGLVGRSSAWLAKRGLDLPLIDWPAARLLEAEGFSCASHTITHPHLSELPAHACRAELRDSRELLEDQLGHAVCDLAYPFGAVSPAVRAIAAETGYRSACSTQIGRSDLTEDALMLHRIPVNGDESLPDFICRLHTARSYGELRGDIASGIRRRLRLQRRHSIP
jgi:peptidoglycan/xylan/chitin deacetylase (PgdA/CDA1 family)